MKAADACNCSKTSVNTTTKKDGEETSQSKPAHDGRGILKAEKLRASAILVPKSSMREHQFIPAPKNTPVFQDTAAEIPRTQSKIQTHYPSDSQRLDGTQDSNVNGSKAAKEVQSQSKEIAPTLEDEDLLDKEEEAKLDDETPRRRQLSDADIQSVRESMTHLKAQSNQDLVNSAESDQATPLERDGHIETPKFPHEILTPTIPHSTYTPRPYTNLTPKLFPQAHSRIPTISMLNDPILAAFPTGDHGLLNRTAAMANSKEKFEDEMIHEWTNGEGLISDEEEEEEQLNAIVHSPTFKHEVPLDYQHIRRQSIQRGFSPPTGMYCQSNTLNRSTQPLSALVQ